MREPTRAPAYAVLYHGLAAKAHGHGYALAIHGSVSNDLDLVAVPWVESADNADTLAHALMQHIHACGHPVTGDDSLTSLEWEDKPHGRRAVNLYMGHGAKVDLSVMPIQPPRRSA